MMHEIRVARMCNDVHDMLRQMTFDQKVHTLHADEAYEALVQKFGPDAWTIMAWGDMYMLDMMFIRSGGNFKMHEHGRPRFGDMLDLNDKAHIVTRTGLFTFQAEAV
jgi:hypothetical protein